MRTHVKKAPNDEEHRDVKRLDYLESLIELGSARIIFNEDDECAEDDFGAIPLGFSIRIRACEEESHFGATLREAIDNAMAVEELADIIDENVDIFVAAVVCFNCREVYADADDDDECQQCGAVYDGKETDACPECRSEFYDIRCPECGSTDVIYLDEVVAEWNDLVYEVEKKDVLAAIKKFVTEQMNRSKNARRNQSKQHANEKTETHY